MERTDLFVFLILFWTLLTIATNISWLGINDLTPSSITEFTPDGDPVADSGNIITNFIDGLEQMPVLNILVPFFKIISFQYTDQIPSWLSTFLVAFTLFTAYILITMVKT